MKSLFKTFCLLLLVGFNSHVHAIADSEIYIRTGTWLMHMCSHFISRQASYRSPPLCDCLFVCLSVWIIECMLLQVLW